MKTVCIELDDNGQFSVGIEPENESALNGGAPEGSPQEEQGDKSFMQPAASLDDALEQARQLLSDGADTAQANDAAFQSGFKAVRGGADAGAAGMLG